MRFDREALCNSCLFCDPASHNQSDQILLKSDNFYVFAGLGAIIEGYLIIAPYACESSGGHCSSLANLSKDLLDELAYLRGLVSAFYRDTYGHPGLSFEHGRAGGCNPKKQDTKHCYHPHLCCYPGTVHDGTGYRDDDGKHTYLWDHFALPNCRIANGIHTITDKVKQLPYLYIEHYNTNYQAKSGMPSESRIFIIPNEDVLASQYLRRNLASLIKDEDKWDWAAFPTEKRVYQVIQSFNEWLADNGARYGVDFAKKKNPCIVFENSASRLTELTYERVASKFKERWKGTLQYNTVGHFLSHILTNESGGTDNNIRIIDVGCGPGFYTKVFADLGFECCAVDYSKKMLQEAERYLSDSLFTGAVRLLQSKVEDLTGEIKEKFDAVWVSAVLLHIPRRRILRVVENLSSLLNHEGVLYLSVRLLRTEEGFDYPALEIREEGRVFVYYQRNELENLFADANLRIVKSWLGTTSVGTHGEKNIKPWCHYLLKRRNS
jgi:SAM-dependent methyltransferase/diadenosine tetraphosphate (Ap4A) HIT family hydrolase